MLINSILLPVLINMIIKNNIYGVDGLADQVCYFALTNLVLSVGLKFLNFSLFFNRLGKWYRNWVCQKWGKTQRQLNKDSDYMTFDMGLKYAEVNFTLLYTAFFASLQPVIVLFAVFSVYFGSWGQTFIKLNLSKSQNSFNSAHISQEMTSFVYLAPLFYAVGNFLWTDIYATQVSHFRLTNIITFVLSLMTFFIIYKMELFRGMWKRLEMWRAGWTEQEYDAYLKRNSYDDKKFEKFQGKFESDYDLANPQTRLKAYRRNIQKSLHKQMSRSKVIKINQIQSVTFDDESYIRHGKYFDLSNK